MITKDLPPESVPDPSRSRRRRAATREWPIILVLLCVAAGFGVVLSNHFRRGSVVIAGALLLAAFLRLVLPTRLAGLLAVRSRAFDVAVLTVLGLGLFLTAVVVPPPS
jgi:hypothetical protein